MPLDVPKVYVRGEWITCKDWRYWYDMYVSAADDAIGLRERVRELEEEKCEGRIRNTNPE